MKRSLNETDRTGAVLPLMATLLPVLLIVMAYAIHVAYVESVQARVQTVADAAARSAGRAYAQTGSRNAALAAAQLAASRNHVAGEIIPITMGDLEFGLSDRGTEGRGYSFHPLAADYNGDPGNSVRVTTNTLNTREPPVLKPPFPTFGINAPIKPLKVAANTQGVLDVALVLDRSGSMYYADDEDSNSATPPAAMPAGWVFGDPIFSPSKWTDTVSAVNQFVIYLDETWRREKISVSTYASTSSTELQLSFDTAAVAPALAQTSNPFDGGATAIGLGLTEGLAALTDPLRSRSYASKVMILMTDGIHNTDIPPEDLIPALQEASVTVFTITFGAAADEDRMRDLAMACGGEHFNASSASQLRSVFQSIARHLPALMTQ